MQLILLLDMRRQDEPPTHGIEQGRDDDPQPVSSEQADTTMIAFVDSRVTIDATPAR